MPDKFKGRVIMPNAEKIGGLAFGLDPAAVTDVAMDLEARALKKVTLTFTDLAITMTDGTTNGSIGDQALLTLPAADVLVMGVRLDLSSIVAAANIGATGDIKFGIGTVAIATDDTMATTDIDIMGQQDVTLVGSAGTLTGASAGVGPPSATPVAVDGNAGTQQLFLNLGVADADSTDDSTVTISGTCTIQYLDLTA